MSRLATFVYGVFAYALFFVAFLYAIGFVGNLWVPKSIDGGAAGSRWVALGIDAALLALFALQHSGMARPAFKRWWTRYVPEPIERSTYVLLASSILLLLFALWRPLPDTVWEVTHPVGVRVLWSLFALGWAIVFSATFMIGHADLFGLRQVWLHLRSQVRPPDRFRVPGLYAVVRHPIMLGFLVAFWATPAMSAGHLLFAAMTTGYILVATRLEERDLLARFGETYRAYRNAVPALLPRPWRRRTPVRSRAATENP